MTRKRYIKLLMSVGFSRNKARAWAKAVQRNGHCYSDAAKVIGGFSVIGLRDLTRSIRQTADGLQNLSASLKVVSNSAADWRLQKKTEDVTPPPEPQS